MHVKNTHKGIDQCRMNSTYVIHCLDNWLIPQVSIPEFEASVTVHMVFMPKEDFLLWGSELLRLHFSKFSPVTSFSSVIIWIFNHPKQLFSETMMDSTINH